MTFARACVAFAAGCALLGPAPSLAGPDSLCIRFEGSAAGETVVLSRGRIIAGALPVTLCGIEPNAAYRLELGGAGFERRIGSLRIDGDGASVGGIRFGTLLRNAIAPGWGSSRAGRGGAAFADVVSLAAILGVFAGEQREYDHIRNRLDVLEALAADAETYEAASRANEAAHEAVVMANVQNAHRRRLAVLCGALYGWQAIEPLWADPPPNAGPGPESGSLVLAGAPRSRAKAFVYSLLRPGRGQIYQGKSARGLIFSAGSLAAGVAALEYWNRYDEAAGAYDLCVERFEAAESVPEKEALASACRLLRANADDERRNRAVSIAVLAAIWGWNCADTFFDAGDVRVSRYSVEIDPRGAAVAVRF
jgi:hypothetical protein